MEGSCKTRLLQGQDLRAHSVGTPVTAGREDIAKGGLSPVLRALADEREGRAPEGQG